MDRVNCFSSTDEESSISSSEDDQQSKSNNVTPYSFQRKRASKQLRYYYRKTDGKAKRKYTRYSEQKHPSKQLRRYHLSKKEDSLELSDTEDTEDSLAKRSNSDNDSVETTLATVNDLSDHDSLSEEEMSVSSSSSSTLNSISESSSDYESADDSDDPSHRQNQEGNEAEYDKEDDEDPLYEGSKISKVLYYVLIVTFVLKHNLSKSAWADLLRLLAIVLGEKCKKTVFQSVYKMKLFMKDYFGSKDATKVFYCGNCLNQVQEQKCNNASCQKSKVSTFLDLHFEEKLKELFRDANFFNLIQKGKKQIKHSVGQHIHDLYHGLDYKNFLYLGGFLTQKYNISFTVNTDGVNKFNSSKAGHLWPVYLMINELPKEYRFKKKYLIPAYIYCDKQDPNMVTFLNPFVDKLNILHKNGIEVSNTAAGNITVRCMLFIASVDLPARADLMNMKRFNGVCSCHLCKRTGTGYGRNNLHRAWPYEKTISTRTHEEQIDFASRATQSQAVMGVKGHCVFAKLSYPFDLIRSFAIDWMHCVCLGVVKYIMEMVLSEGNKGSVFYIGSSKGSLTKKLLSIKPPDIVGRLPRCLEDLKHWKATEFKNWLLHYSEAVLCGTMHPLYFFHWTLLIGGTGILCSDSISKQDLEKADSMLQDFVFLMTILYGQTKCTMNVHLLQHFAYYVTRRGPLWSYSCFAFESMNAFIKPLIHGTHHAMEQVGAAIGLCYGISDFTQKHLEKSRVPKECKDLLRRLTGCQKSSSNTSINVKGGYLCGQNKKSNVDNNMKTLLKIYVLKQQLPLDSEIETYRRFESIDGQKFYSDTIKTRKTDSSVIEYIQNNTVNYGKIITFFRIQDQGFCFCNKLQENIQFANFDPRDCRQSLPSLTLNDSDRDDILELLKKYENIQIVNHHVYLQPQSTSMTILSVGDIRRKCVLMDFCPEVWIVSRFPNIIEHN